MYMVVLITCPVERAERERERAEKFCGTCGTKNPHYGAAAYSTRSR
jgi:hypothetical protein